MKDTSHEVDVPECSVKASSIKVIDKKSVHRICSGQVVLTLSTAVKELVENSIDAGATSVEVRLKDYGSESIEVIDNGTGVEEINFEGLTLKHHTSKLTDFDDLVNVSTFGFRGEALSSLCALSNMTIITRHESSDVGTRLQFDVNGRILSRKFIPKPVGTVVLIQNIFHSLPVRHKEFQKNVKKEFARLIQVLNAYCIINTGVRISCMNQTAKGNRNTVVSTNGNVSMRENISNVFGSKQLQSLLEFKQIDPKDEICEEYGVKALQNSIHFSITGFVSKCEHGQGRSSSDRQFIFINKRPCDTSKVLKLINEVYHSYNRHQYPFVSLSIEMKKESVDVNVTPDKRQIFLDGEKLLLAVLKTSLINIFEPTSSLYKMNNLFSPVINSSCSSQSPKTPFLLTLSSPLPQKSDDDTSISNSFRKLKRSFSSAFDKNRGSPSTDVNFNQPPPKTFAAFSSSSSPFIKKSHEESLSCKSSSSITQFFTPVHRKSTVVNHDGGEVCKNGATTLTMVSHSVDGAGDNICVNNNNNKDCQDSEEVVSRVEAGLGRVDKGLETDYAVKSSFIVRKDRDIVDIGADSDRAEDVKVQTVMVDEETPSNEMCQLATNEHISDQEKENQLNLESLDPTTGEGVDTVGNNRLESVEHVNDADVVRERKETVVEFSLANLRKRLIKRHADNSGSSSFSRAFRAKISPGDNKTAEEELQREISKDMFSKMEILGQFNLGFIITRLGSDLFIVDQHATDEKYNFEMLQRNHVLQSQKMITPQSLELTSSNETILLDNLDVFKKNGFDFLIQPEAPPTQRVKLVSAPVSKNWSFGKDDIEELLFMLMDSPNVMCRPTRVRMMFASRACRKSIMIGTALNHHQMTRLVTHMGEIEQPWNCPHGRPTMRHLFNLNMLPS